jgi:hypothetical protein
MKTKKEPFKGEWITPFIESQECKIRSVKPGFNRTKQGWELTAPLIYCDNKYRLWVALPGYLWDGPSYPSSKTALGKLLTVMVGNRRKKGLLAASAQHDQMAQLSHIIQTNENKLKTLKKNIENGTLDKYLSKQTYDEIEISIREAAYLYKDMLQQWPIKEETISNWKSFKQFLGLRLFQPWYRLFVTGPEKNDWVKVEE